MELIFQIIGITESWLKPNNVNDYTPMGYSYEYNIRLGRNGGGVSLFISDKLTYKTREDLNLETSSESNLVAIEIDKHSVGSNKVIVVVLIYRPPSTSIATFNQQLSTLIDDVQKENKYVLFMGDFNVNVSKQIKGGKDIQEFTNLFLSNSFLTLINKPTRMTGTLIDNFYTNFSINNCHSEIGTDFSDHFPKFCIFDKCQ